MNSKTYEHGGNFDEAIKAFGGAPSDWLDLSTGINRVPYPVSRLEGLRHLPTLSEIRTLCNTAAHAYKCKAPIIASHGVQAIIQVLPRIFKQGKVAHIWPSYNEYPRNFSRLGWEVLPAQNLSECEGANIAVVVNPNNPTGDYFDHTSLKALAKKVDFLFIDESFMDTGEHPSIVKTLTADDNIIVLRSFGKFFGLAGLRLGFAMGNQKVLDLLAEELGPWQISGFACALGAEALANRDWHEATRARLFEDAARFDQIISALNWCPIGGTNLFRLFEIENAKNMQAELAQSYIWTRVFSYHPSWMRIGLPGSETEWAHLQSAIDKLSK